MDDISRRLFSNAAYEAIEQHHKYEDRKWTIDVNDIPVCTVEELVGLMVKARDLTDLDFLIDSRSDNTFVWYASAVLCHDSEDNKDRLINLIKDRLTKEYKVMLQRELEEYIDDVYWDCKTKALGA